MKKQIINPVEKAIEILGGNQKSFAEKFNVTQQSVSKWLKRGIFPPRRVACVEKLTGIPKHTLNPEIFSL